MNPTHPTLPPEELEALAELFVQCAEAMYEDSEVTINGNGTNASEASEAYDAVAGILGLTGPTELLNQRYELEAEPA